MSANACSWSAMRFCQGGYIPTLCSDIACYFDAPIFFNSRSSWCLVHKQECSVVDRIGFVHVAGTPCTAYSPAGLCDKETALSFCHFLAWAGLRGLCQEPVIVQECTDAFPRELFSQLLPTYDWTFEVISPQQLGWPVRRPRQWAVSEA